MKNTRTLTEKDYFEELHHLKQELIHLTLKKKNPQWFNLESGEVLGTLDEQIYEKSERFKKLVSHFEKVEGLPSADLFLMLLGVEL